MRCILEIAFEPFVSVIILTRNGMPLVEQCLRAVLDQETSWLFEVIVIDSGSSDGTLELVKSLPVELICIKPKEFNHGQTRNFGASKARGEYIVFLVQDAVPVDDTFLQRLVEAAQLPGAAGSYGRELPWPSDHSLIRLNMEKTLSQHQEQMQQSLPSHSSWQELSPQMKFELATFHDTCSCLCRQIWKEHSFRPLAYGEDLDWGARVIRAGYKIVSEPRAAVYHSHDRSSWYELKRAYADHELVMSLFGYHLFPSLSGVVWSWMSGSWSVIRTIWHEPGPRTEKVALLLRAPLLMAARYFGAYIGARVATLESRGSFWKGIDSLMRKGV
jgi:rhamnosyltransferase